MKFTIRSYLLIFLIFFQEFIERADFSASFCHLNGNEMECKNFLSFEQLNFTEFLNSSIKQLKLYPLNLTKLENLNSNGLNLDNDSNILLRNISEFQYYLSSDFNIFKGMSLDLDDSIFKFNEINKTILEK